MIAFHNDSALRDATLAEMQAHHDADRLVQGWYWEDGRGCAVGCLTHDPHGGHAQYPVRWGIPTVLARLEDRIFEGLPTEGARKWPLRFLGAIRVGADLTGVWPRFAHVLLVDPEYGVARHTQDGSLSRVAVTQVAALYQRAIDGGIVAREEWREARDADYAAADAAADAAASYAAAAAAAAAYARRDHYMWMASLLEQLLRDAPIGKTI